jgi:hypothetical protein
VARYGFQGGEDLGVGVEGSLKGEDADGGLRFDDLRYPPPPYRKGKVFGAKDLGSDFGEKVP